MRKRLLSLGLLLSGLSGYSQSDPLSTKELEIADQYARPQWIQKNKFGVNLGEVAFVNWNAGGTNTVTAMINAESSVNYKDPYAFWNNNVSVKYGLNKQDGKGLQKTNDVFEINSNMGYKNDSLSNWFYSAKLNFKTQLMNGYSYPNRANPISRSMAPGYLFLGGGFEYGKHIEELSVYFSPMTLKTTFVLDDRLANAGFFGVTPAIYDVNGILIRNGERVQKEAGVLMTNAFERQMFENIKVKHQMSLYTDYINSFGNIDVDWQIDIDFRVNDFVKASLGSHIRYDNDVKNLESTDVEGEFDEAGAKAQWKQMLGIGFEVVF
ncbi:MAG TPA: DUF3078 domain-containing protein [Flavobacteriaceae bacterium]